MKVRVSVSGVASLSSLKPIEATPRATSGRSGRPSGSATASASVVLPVENDPTMATRGMGDRLPERGQLLVVRVEGGEHLAKVHARDRARRGGSTVDDRLGNRRALNIRLDRARHGQHGDRKEQ